MRQTADSDTDYGQLDDPEFLDLRAKTRERLAEMPEDSSGYLMLSAEYEAMNAEFTERAAERWSA
jgi:hypothetical protein